MTNTTYVSSGKSIPVDVYQPPAGITPNGALVVLAHGSDGLVPPWEGMIRKFAEELETRKFTVILPWYFGQKTPPVHPLPDALQTSEKALADGVVFGRTLPGVNATRTGFVGFSLGGYFSLRLRKSAKAVVSFFAPEMLGIGPRPSPPLALAQLHHPEADSVSSADRLYHRLKSEGSAVELHSYAGATHGFAAPGDALALRQSRALTIEFLEARL